MECGDETLLARERAVSRARMWADVPDHRWDGYSFDGSPQVTNRLDQGPFGLSQDEGWFTIFVTHPYSQSHPKFRHGFSGFGKLVRDHALISGFDEHPPEGTNGTLGRNWTWSPPRFRRKQAK